MIEETGMVVEAEGENAWVETSRKTSCGSCEAKGCGTGALSKVLGRKSQSMAVRNPIGAKPGEQVVLGISESALIKGSLAVYLVPLCALLAGGLFGELMAAQMQWGEEGATILFAFIGLGLSLLWLQRFNRRAANDETFSAVILRRVQPTSVETVNFDIK